MESLWTGPTSSGRPSYPTPTFVRAQGLQAAASSAARPPADDEGLRWYREFNARAASSASSAAATRPGSADGQLSAPAEEDDDDDEVQWVPQDEGSDSEIEFVEAVSAAPPPSPPPPPPPAAPVAPSAPALARPFPVPNPRPTPSLFPLPPAVALPAAPMGTNHFLPFSPPAAADDPAAAGAARKGSKMVDLLVLPADDAGGPAFQPPAYFALGSDNVGHRMLRAQGWEGRALGQPSSSSSSTSTGASSPAAILGAGSSDEPTRGGPSRSLLAPVSTSLLPPKRGLSSAMLANKRVTHTAAQIEAARQQAKVDRAGRPLSGKERARQDAAARDHRRALAAALNTD